LAIAKKVIHEKDCAMIQSEPFIGHLLLNPPALTAIVRRPRKVPPLSKAKCGRMEAYVGMHVIFGSRESAAFIGRGRFA